MPKLPLLVLSLVAFAGLLAATPAPALAGEAQAPAHPPSGAPSLCSADASTVPAVGTPEPQLMLVFPCSDCSDALCFGKNLGNRCGAGPDFEGFRCNGLPTCPADGRIICTCELV